MGAECSSQLDCKEEYNLSSSMQLTPVSSERRHHKTVQAVNNYPDFDESERKKKGPCVLDDGSIFDGYWVGEIRDGFGTQKWSNGRKYVGYFKQNMKTGTGTYFWPDGRIFEGSWLNDKQHGEGKLIMSDGKCFYGVWENGLLVKRISKLTVLTAKPVEIEQLFTFGDSPTNFTSSLGENINLTVEDPKMLQSVP